MCRYRIAFLSNVTWYKCYVIGEENTRKCNRIHEHLFTDVLVFTDLFTANFPQIPCPINDTQNYYVFYLGKEVFEKVPHDIVYR